MLIYFIQYCLFYRLIKSSAIAIYSVKFPNIDFDENEHFFIIFHMHLILLFMIYFSSEKST